MSAVYSFPSPYTGATKEQPPPRSLARILFTRAILVASGGIILYSAFEILFDPPVNLLNFLTHHFIHVAAIGVAVWIVCWLAVKENILDPVAAISRHLYQLRRGRLEALEFQTPACEMQKIIIGVNSLTEKLRAANAGDLEKALTSVQELRVGLGKLAVQDADEKVSVMHSLTRLESALFGIMCREQKW